MTAISPERRAFLETVEHVVYRCYDADDRLLYVGCTEDIGSRLAVHASAWGNPASAALILRMARHTETPVLGKSAAREVERRAIYNEAPLLNLHHQKVKRTAAQRLRDIEQYLADTRPPVDPALMAALPEATTLPTGSAS